MRCINKNKIMTRSMVLVLVLFVLTGCSSKNLVMEHRGMEADGGSDVSTYNGRIAGFSDELCVTAADIIPDGMPELLTSVGLFCVNTREVLYANNIHDRMHPASLTKVMTALVLLKQYSGDFTDKVTVSENVNITESGVQMCGFKEGDIITLDQALYGLLVYSGNDAAVIIAEYVAGSVEGFANRMNQEAKRLGATNTNFTNPHGLTDEDHYTTAYDLYLMFQEAVKYEKFREIIHASSYQFVYQGADGNNKNMEWSTTNLYLKGDRMVPENVILIGGKTGTTNIAGSCLVLLSQDVESKDYISIILKANDRTILYDEMTELLSKINH